MADVKLFLVHKNTKRRFEVLGVDHEAGTISLKGELATIVEKYDPKRFKELGYVLEKEAS